MSYAWNYGSLLGLFLMIQIASGFLLATHYEASLEHSFQSVVVIDFDTNHGWLFRSIHANGASWFFILMYSHVFRGLWVSSFSQPWVWVSGVAILFASMATAFLGYVLPWGQMSFWGATVITNLLSALPFGPSLVVWIWGGFSVSNPTLVRFFSIHFILPFLIAVLVVAHLAFLHVKGSSNPLGLHPQSGKIYFYPYFLAKDLVGILAAVSLFSFLLIVYPDLFMDPDNYMECNPMVTPAHIQPEWYFLFAYAILRAVPNKLGGVMALVFSIAILAVMPLIHSHTSAGVNPWHSLWMYSLMTTFFLLSWLGAMPVEAPFVSLSQLMAVVYFSLFFSWPLAMNLGSIKFF
uniref:Cytochrome b n=1 Tax=Pedicinus obtusus TaxID=592408 RepID=A0A7L9CY23_9NEOP|nr:cytochrome b [Pedicinus obtusus]